MNALSSVSLPRLLSAPAARSAACPEEAAPQDQVEIGTAPAPREPELVNVGHQRELRGAWVATVYNINFPKSQTSTPETQKAELVAMLDRLQETRFNAIFFQVRPEGDALYKSELEPWSGSLTGKQGKDPGYDPLAFLVEEAHKRGIEVHAWLNPYRAGAATKDQVAPHIGAIHPEHVHKYGAYEWMDPGAKPVQERLVDVCADLTKRYNIDGIHFDDYFYPYPDGNKQFPDDVTYKAYQDAGGKLNRADWRRENVNQAVRDVNQAVRAEKDHVRFGISPFGLPAPERPPGVTGFDQYESLYADTQKWMDEGIVDYLAPQLYWPTTQPKQPYGTLVNWWADHTSGGRHIFAGNNLADLGTAPKWSVDEYKREVALSRAKYPAGSTGNIWWHIAPLMEDRKGIVKVFKDELYKDPALSPALSTAAGKTVAHPSVQVVDGKVQLQHQDSAPLRAWTVYKQQGDQWKLDRILPGTESSVELPAGKWAVAAATMHGVESKGVTVTLG
jgi:uncharacterized lipoprotein YddW (UPF0748 family)